MVKETYPYLKNCTDINFIGNIEARDIPKGVCDVVVCDGFSGNVVLKTIEGFGLAVFGILKETLLKINFFVFIFANSKICIIFAPSIHTKTVKTLHFDDDYLHK